MYGRKPTEGHERLARLAGTWVARETMMPSPWVPEKTNATAHMEARLALDGLLLVTDYRQERDGKTTSRGHGTYAYDPDSDRYSMFWYDDMSPDPTSATFGKWDGDTLIFEQAHADRTTRFVYELMGDGVYRFHIDVSKDGGEFETWLDSTWTRQG